MKAVADWRVPSDLESVIDYCWQDQPVHTHRYEPEYVRDACMRLELARVERNKHPNYLSWKFACRTGLYYASGLSKYRVGLVLQDQCVTVISTLARVHPYVVDPDLRIIPADKPCFADEYGLTRSELCRAIGISVGTLRRYEKGEKVNAQPVLDSIFVQGIYPLHVLSALADKRYDNIMNREAVHKRYLAGD